MPLLPCGARSSSDSSISNGGRSIPFRRRRCRTLPVDAPVQLDTVFDAIKKAKDVHLQISDGSTTQFT